MMLVLGGPLQLIILTDYGQEEDTSSMESISQFKGSDYGYRHTKIENNGCIYPCRVYAMTIGVKYKPISNHPKV